MDTFGDQFIDKMKDREFISKQKNSVYTYSGK